MAKGDFELLPASTGIAVGIFDAVFVSLSGLAGMCREDLSSTTIATGGLGPSGGLCAGILGG